MTFGAHPRGGSALGGESLLEHDQLLTAELTATGLDVSMLAVETLSGCLYGRCVELKFSDAELKCAVFKAAENEFAESTPLVRRLDAHSFHLGATRPDTAQRSHRDERAV